MQLGKGEQSKVGPETSQKINIERRVSEITLRRANLKFHLNFKFKLTFRDLSIKAFSSQFKAKRQS